VGAPPGHIEQVSESSQPGWCPHGHWLGPKRVLVGWMPCDCRRALEAGTVGRAMGHTSHRCLACQDQGRDTVHYDPPHIAVT
jgi:hypothetical protein